LIEIINKQLLLQLVGYLCYWQMGFNSVFKGLMCNCRWDMRIKYDDSISQMYLQLLRNGSGGSTRFAEAVKSADTAQPLCGIQV